jgi:ATP-dependent exoDNAse (exonuclease V) beta subunit
VHAILAAIDFEADSAQIASVAATLGRTFDAPIEEVQAAATTVAAALRHPVLRGAAAAAVKGEVRRETPVLFAMPDRTLAEGVLDLAFREERQAFAGWTVVDFKTDQEFAPQSERYIRQVGLYATAVEAATRLAARGVLLIL